MGIMERQNVGNKGSSKNSPALSFKIIKINSSVGFGAIHQKLWVGAGGCLRWC